MQIGNVEFRIVGFAEEVLKRWVLLMLNSDKRNLAASRAKIVCSATKVHW